MKNHKRDQWLQILEILGALVFGGLAAGFAVAGIYSVAFAWGFLAVGCGFGIIAHIIKELDWVKSERPLFCTLMFLNLLTFLFLYWHMESQAKKALEPTISQTRIHLASDDAPITTTVTVYNPTEHPLYNVILKIAIEQPFIPASSITIEPNISPELRNEFKESPVSMRNDFEIVPNSKPSFSSYAFGVIPPNSQTVLIIGGSIKTNSWADLSIAGYEPNLAVSGWNSNYLMTVPINPQAIVGKGLNASFRLSDIPYGAIFLTNGVPAFTNLPHLQVGIDLSDFGKTNLLLLKDGFLFSSNNTMRPGDITGLLTLPTSESASNSTIKIVLNNDTGVVVSNVTFFFNSAEPFNWRSNDVWIPVPEVPGAPTNDMFRWAIFTKSDKISPGTYLETPYSFATTTNLDNSIAVAIAVSANDMPEQLIAFWLMFCRTNADSHSTITPVCHFTRIYPEVSTNGIRFRFPPITVEFK
jgi:hypothetical protein